MVIMFITGITTVWGQCPGPGSYADITCFTMLRGGSFETEEKSVITLRHM
jgi:hypothetical protein